MSFLGRGKGFPAILICFGETEKVVLFEHSDQIQCNVIASCETEKLSAAAATIHLCSLKCRRFGTIRAKLKHASWKGALAYSFSTCQYLCGLKIFDPSSGEH